MAWKMSSLPQLESIKPGYLDWGLCEREEPISQCTFSLPAALVHVPIEVTPRF